MQDHTGAFRTMQDHMVDFEHVCVSQGNGHERDFLGDRRVFIMDVYNRHIYPGDRIAKRE